MVTSSIGLLIVLEVVNLCVTITFLCLYVSDPQGSHALKHTLCYCLFYSEFFIETSN